MKLGWLLLLIFIVYFGLLYLARFESTPRRDMVCSENGVVVYEGVVSTVFKDESGTTIITGRGEWLDIGSANCVESTVGEVSE